MSLGAAEVGHVEFDDGGFMKMSWFAGADYPANGSAGRKVGKPAGRSPTGSGWK